MSYGGGSYAPGGYAPGGYVPGGYVPTGGYVPGNYAALQNAAAELQADATTAVNGVDYTQSSGSDPMGLALAQQTVNELPRDQQVAGNAAITGGWADQGGSAVKDSSGNLVVTNGYVISWGPLDGTNIYTISHVTGTTTATVDASTGLVSFQKH